MTDSDNFDEFYSRRSDGDLRRKSCLVRSDVACSFVAALWIALILFASTSSAGRFCDGVFAANAQKLSGVLRITHIRYAGLHFWAEKSIHLMLFSILALLFWKSFANGRGKSAWILSAGTLVGCASEILQRFFPGRDPTLRDVGFDIAGTIVGIIIASMQRRGRSLVISQSTSCLEPEPMLPSIKA